ncbi:uncharacterized protein LOC110044644 [Orbicella faveolata]|uniref:uncharacterized protein LOC110044644 n=1 Tax=Orbicella faveolata TaxID=48498 RepID=UPI0009E53331|nr:uncharacterized protein LOC110044644 [Orbicella faveolata]
MAALVWSNVTETANVSVQKALNVTAVSCKELYDKHKSRESQVYPLMFSEQTIPVYCHMENFGCGDGGWTLAMKINGNKSFSFVLPEDAALINHVLTKYKVTSVIDCAHRCIRESRCVSFNYEDHATSLRHVCQINDEKKQKNFENFIGLDGFSYYEFEPFACGVGCQNGGTCLEQCDGNRKCICTEGYTGVHCENILTKETLRKKHNKNLSFVLILSIYIIRFMPFTC